MPRRPSVRKGGPRPRAARPPRQPDPAPPSAPLPFHPPQPLIRSLGPAANPANLGPALNSAGLWAFYAAYLGVVMFSTLPPGPPAWATPGPVLAEAFDESVNIFWIKWVPALVAAACHHVLLCCAFLTDLMASRLPLEERKPHAFRFFKRCNPNHHFLSPKRPPQRAALPASPVAHPRRAPPPGVRGARPPRTAARVRRGQSPSASACALKTANGHASLTPSGQQTSPNMEQTPSRPSSTL